jgi:tRNA A22 N-methylase
MIPDGLTKDQQDPADLLRSAMFLGEYQLNEEASVLEQKKRYREERRLRQIRQSRKEEDDQKRKAENRKFQN